MKNINISYYAKRIPLVFIALLLGWFIITFLLFPNASLLYNVFFSSGRFTFDAIHKLFGSSRVIKSLVNSFVMAFLTIITVNCLGLFQVAVTDFFDIKFSKALRLAFFTPLIYSSISLVTGYKFVYGSHGALTKLLQYFFPSLSSNWFVGFAAVLFVHSFSMTTNHIIFVRNATRKIDNSTIEAARTLGANNFQIFIKIALPILKPSIYAATLMLFLTALGSNAAPTVLGGKDFEMINSLILTLNSIRRVDMAAILSLILGLSSFVLLLLFRSIEKKGHYTSLSTSPSTFKKLKISNPAMNIFIHTISYILFFIYLLPILFIVAFSFAPSKIILTEIFPTKFTLVNYIYVFTNIEYLKPLLNSISLSLITVVASLAISIISAIFLHKNKSKIAFVIELCMFIPWMIPSSMLAMGLITSFSNPNILIGNKILLGTFGILPIGYTISRLPFTLRMLNATLLGINQNIEDAARSLGANIFYTYINVILPILMPTILSISALTFNSMLSEYTMTALLYNINNKPLGIVLSTGAMSNEPEQTARILVYVVILMIISLSTILITNYLNNKQINGENNEV